MHGVYLGIGSAANAPGQRRSTCRPCAMQRAGGFDPDHRRPADAAAGDQPLEFLDTVAEHRQRHRLPDQAALPVVSQSRWLTLPGSIATTSRSPGTSLSSSSKEAAPEKKRLSRLAPKRAPFNAALSSYQLRVGGAARVPRG